VLCVLIVLLFVMFVISEFLKFLYLFGLLAKSVLIVLFVFHLIWDCLRLHTVSTITIAMTLTTVIRTSNLTPHINICVTVKWPRSGVWRMVF
jgi:hypothetical protein